MNHLIELLIFGLNIEVVITIYMLSTIKKDIDTIWSKINKLKNNQIRLKKEVGCDE